MAVSSARDTADVDQVHLATVAGVRRVDDDQATVGAEAGMQVHSREEHPLCRFPQHPLAVVVGEEIDPRADQVE